MERIIIDGLSFALPLLIIAIGGIYSEKSGITNLALEGLLGFGAFTGGLFLTLTEALFPTGSHMYLALGVAAVGGLVFSILHALLCIRFKTNQVISGVVINILSMAATSFLTSQINASVFGNPSDKFMFSVSPRITVPYLSDVPVLGAVFRNFGKFELTGGIVNRNFYPFEAVILCLMLISWYTLYRTRYGMRVRACGDNPQAVDAAGIRVSRIRFTAVLLSGACCGLGGMCFAYSISTNFSGSIYFGAGYLAIAALIFGNWRIISTFGACLLFGFARSGAYELMKVMQLSSSFSYLAMTIPYLLTLILLAFFSKSNRAPRALGEIYDKGKR